MAREWEKFQRHECMVSCQEFLDDLESTDDAGSHASGKLCCWLANGRVIAVEYFIDHSEV